MIASQAPACNRREADTRSGPVQGEERETRRPLIPGEPSPPVPAGARLFGRRFHWSSEILNGPGLGRTRSCKFRRYPKTYLDDRTRVPLPPKFSSPSTHSPPSPVPPPSKWPTLRKARLPRSSLVCITPSWHPCYPLAGSIWRIDC